MRAFVVEGLWFLLVALLGYSLGHHNLTIGTPEKSERELTTQIIGDVYEIGCHHGVFFAWTNRPEPISFDYKKGCRDLAKVEQAKAEKILNGSRHD